MLCVGFEVRLFGFQRHQLRHTPTYLHSTVAHTHHVQFPSLARLDVQFDHMRQTNKQFRLNNSFVIVLHKVKH